MAARMLWMFFLPAAWSFHVEVNPQDPVYHYGEKLSLNCSVVDCSEPDSLSWTTLDDMPVGAEPERRTSPTTTLLVISSVKPMHETSNVYPAQALWIEWIQGGSVLKMDRGKGSLGSTKEKLQEVSSVHSLPPEINGENITCRATLIVTKDRHEIKETTVALTVLISPRKVSIVVSPAEEVKEGNSVSISCVSDGGSDGSMELHIVREGQETPLQASLDTPTFLTYKLPSVQLSDSGLYRCVAANQTGNQTASAQVRVFGSPPSPPETLDLKKVIIPTVVAGSLLAAAAVIIRYRRKSKGSDAYSLAVKAPPVV
ncbi:hypothetical protein MATL_G00237400 [Megalops atlanticus]|uniref:Ig-like domain-containing protein n=1 Tax=Megalops atlanticus TaxID=7932 RepID=A0A9D3PBM6_MEGAT|nr:hypothetical protein MATL_G00237400 [Megalops atlanticus]